MSSGHRQGGRQVWWAAEPGRAILGLLLVTDLAFVLVFAGLELHLLQDERLSLAADRGLPETWEYIKLLWSGLALSVLLWRRRDPLYLALGVVVGSLLVDDVVGLHQRVGAWLRDSGAIGPVLGVPASKVGETMVVAAAALLLLVLVAVSVRWSSSAARRVATGVLLCLGLLAVAGVGLDLLQAVVADGHPVMVLFEDGGELAVGSLLAGFLLTTAVVGDDRMLPWRTADPSDMSHGSRPSARV